LSQTDELLDPHAAPLVLRGCVQAVPKALHTSFVQALPSSAQVPSGTQTPPQAPLEHAKGQAVPWVPHMPPAEQVWIPPWVPHLAEPGTHSPAQAPFEHAKGQAAPLTQ